MTVKTVGDLLAELGDYDPDTEVRVAIQPSWPLALTVESVTRVTPEDSDECVECYCPAHEHSPGCSGCGDCTAYAAPEAPGPGTPEHRDANVVWIATGTVDYDEHPYAPKAVWGEGY